jgi:hypothetical protein
MKKQDLIAARKELLQLWIDDLENAYDVEQKRLEAALASIPDPEDRIVSGPFVMKVRFPSSDSMTVLIEGLKRAVAGEKDPFRLISAGRPQKFNDSELADAVEKRRHKDKETGETPETLENCFPDVANEFGVSEGRVIIAYKKKWEEARKAWEIYQARNKFTRPEINKTL